MQNSNNMLIRDSNLSRFFPVPAAISINFTEHTSWQGNDINSWLMNSFLSLNKILYDLSAVHHISTVSSKKPHKNSENSILACMYAYACQPHQLHVYSCLHPTQLACTRVLQHHNVYTHQGIGCQRILSPWYSIVLSNTTCKCSAIGILNLHFLIWTCITTIRTSLCRT